MTKDNKILYSTTKTSKRRVKIILSLFICSNIISVNIIAKEHSTDKFNLLELDKIYSPLYESKINNKDVDSNKNFKQETINSNNSSTNNINIDNIISLNSNSNTNSQTTQNSIKAPTQIPVPIASQDISQSSPSIKDNIALQISLLTQKLSEIKLQNKIGNAITSIDNTSKKIGENVIVTTKYISKSMQQGLASWYGKQFHGKKTASGERFNMFAYTAAHRTLPLGSYARITNPTNNKTAVVKITDRGPYAHKRVIDLSFAVAKDLDLLKRGTAPVKIEPLANKENDKATTNTIISNNTFLDLEKVENKIEIK